MVVCMISTDSLCTPPEGDRYGGIERQAWLTVKGLSYLGHTVHLIAKEGSAIPPSGNLYTYQGEAELREAIHKVHWLYEPNVWIDETHDKRLTEFAPDFPQLSRYEVMSLMGNPHCPVLISEGQRDEKFGGAPWPIVPQAIDLDTLPLYRGQRDNYLVYMGQKITEKRIEWACEVAVQTNTPLYIYGPGWGQADCHQRLRDYAERYPNLIHNEGEIGGVEKLDRLQHTKALIHVPGALGWCEAGGIVVLEALATGTPCIVSRNGCLPSYIQTGVNGYVVDSIEEAIDAVQKVDSIHPEDCRKSVEKYDYRLVAHQYEEICQRIIRGERWR